MGYKRWNEKCAYEKKITKKKSGRISIKFVHVLIPPDAKIWQPYYNNRRKYKVCKYLKDSIFKFQGAAPRQGHYDE
jgi:hypothetical protein